MSKIATQCLSCFSNFGVPEKYAGKRVKCPQCGEPMTVEAPALEPPPRPKKKSAPPPEDEFGDSSDEGFLDGVDLGEGDTIKPKKSKTKKRSLALSRERSESGSTSSSGSNGGLMLKGVLMMVGAVVWFVIGWQAGFIYFYPPILLVIGLVTFVKGMLGSDE